MLGAPDAVIDNALSGWGVSPVQHLVRRSAQRTSMPSATTHMVHVICEEYRAAATRDREDDAADRTAGRRISRPVLALWSERGPLNTWYKIRLIHASFSEPGAILRGPCNHWRVH